MNIRPFFYAAAVSLTLVVGSAAATESAEGRVVTGIGRWIAEQGNAALDQLREDLKRNLQDSVKPLLPPDTSRSGRQEAESAAPPA